MDAALRLGGRHALHAMPARLVPQVLVDVVARDAEGDFLEAARFARTVRDRLDRPALDPRVARVHLVEVAREERRLIAALAAADLDDDLGEVLGRIDEELVLDLRVERVALRPHGRELFLGHRLEVGVIAREHPLGVRDASVELLQFEVGLDDLGQRAALAWTMTPDRAGLVATAGS